MQTRTDVELMLEYQKGDELAMTELISRYKNPVYRFALRLGQDSAEAQDVAQEVFLKVHEARFSYEPTGKFSTWIFSIAHNACISRLRKKKWLIPWPRKKEDEEELVDFQSPEPSPEDEVIKSDLSQLIKSRVKELPFLQKEALILREYQDYSYEEIAKILKQPLGTVKILIHRARLALKEKLLPYIEELKGGNL